IEIPYDLVNLDLGATISQRREAHRLDMRIDHRPLSRPVFADAVMAANISAFHSVGPQHVTMHGGENRCHVTGIEPFIESSEELNVGARHLNLSKLTLARAGLRRGQQEPPAQRESAC